MKKVISLFLCALSFYANAATTLPVQLLNPTGSTAGNMIVSSGASSAPIWSNAPTISGGTINNAIIGGITPVSITGSQIIAKEPANGTQTLAVNATSDSNGANIILQGNGATTPTKYIRVTNGQFQIVNNAYSGTPLVLSDSGNLTVTGSIGPSTTAGIVGTTLGDNANAGSWGECIPAQVLSGSAISLTSGTASNITSISLPAGDWRIYGQVALTLGAGAAVTWFAGVPSTTSAPAFSAGSGFLVPGIAAGIVSTLANAIPQIRLNVTTTTTVYLIASSAFSGGTLSAYGYIVGCRGR